MVRNGRILGACEEKGWQDAELLAWLGCEGKIGVEDRSEVWDPSSWVGGGGDPE